ncbi:conserved hypothetical protein [Altererythrobacter sp. B11]|uniref:hypothetical protein n=1 Tax=Altererythrobacter sp. B11 TaxID=2060312 RepID=UPI000DC73C4E|nr:hypothetical protein [Altererythrobacter sp. B11]BBC71561.1 conserved hypothetical protein [Altererythrobacter sp. B11]
MFRPHLYIAGTGARVAGALLLASATVAATPLFAQDSVVSAPAASGPSYADLVRLSEAARIVAIAEVADQAQLKPERAPGLAPGMVRLYVEARTQALLTARAPLGESLAYLVDVPVTEKGKAPKLKKQRFILFASPVPSQPGFLQLVSPQAQLPATSELEARVRAVIAELAAPDAPPHVTGVRDVISVAGNLAGESETQMFFDTDSGDPISVSVLRRPGMEPSWGISWSEIVDQAARPPEHHTLAWYRLACGLPRQLPEDAYLQRDRASRLRAEEDYAFILRDLGPCGLQEG